MPTKVNRQWCLASRPVGLIEPSNFTWNEVPIPTPGDGELLIRNIYLSLDPASWGWMQKWISYVPALAIGDVMHGITLGVVEQSRHAKFHPGDLVYGMLGWQEFAVTNGKGLMKLPKRTSIPLPAYVSVFGLTGLTAYFGLLDIGKPKVGETLVVSAAAGAVGSIVGQIGKVKGCHVVGTAGTDEKCQWLTEELGFDAAINYKTESLHDSLSTHCPNGIDIYFENVGGALFETVLTLINLRARIVLCGLISQYKANGLGPSLASIIVNRARIEGFIASDYFHRAEEAIIDLQKWITEGHIQYKVDIIEGLENAHTAIGKLFDGSNKGKLMVKVSEEPL
ncbi:MAG: NADP-dependent oxidoreductase [Candidatus Thorarchaeota archaeon]|nr:NADP-dependent oxidoreductase [Candidatus Thorarchaeota archaeon]